MIEKKIEDLIASIDANTAALVLLVKAPVASPDHAKNLAKAEKVKAPKPDPEKAAAARIAATEAAAEKDEDADAAPTKEAVALVIETLLKANLRAQAITLLKKHSPGNVSATGVFEQGAEVSTAFINEASEILLAA